MAFPDNREAVFARVSEDAPIDMILMQGDDAVNLTGITELGLVLTPQDGSRDLCYSSLDSVPAVAVQDGNLGLVRFTPVLQDLVTGMVRLLCRWYAVIAGRKYYFPQGGFFEINLVVDPTGYITYQRQCKADGFIVYSV